MARGSLGIRSLLGADLYDLRWIRRPLDSESGSDRCLPVRSNLMSRWKQALITSALCSLAVLVLTVRPAQAQERPYIVTYDHYLEEPRNVEIEYFSTFGTQRGGNDF